VTRKDYVALANAMYGVTARRESFHGNLTWLDCVDAVAGVLAADNPRFDRERFVRACEGGPGSGRGQ
jgi:hypothetical protein